MPPGVSPTTGSDSGGSSAPASGGSPKKDSPAGDGGNAQSGAGKGANPDPSPSSLSQGSRPVAGNASKSGIRPAPPPMSPDQNSAGQQPPNGDPMGAAIHAIGTSVGPPGRETVATGASPIPQAGSLGSPLSLPSGSSLSQMSPHPLSPRLVLPPGGTRPANPAQGAKPALQPVPHGTGGVAQTIGHGAVAVWNSLVGDDLRNAIHDDGGALRALGDLMSPDTVDPQEVSVDMARIKAHPEPIKSAASLAVPLDVGVGVKLAMKEAPTAGKALGERAATGLGSKVLAQASRSVSGLRAAFSGMLAPAVDAGARLASTVGTGAGQPCRQSGNGLPQRGRGARCPSALHGSRSRRRKRREVRGRRVRDGCSRRRHRQLELVTLETR